MHLPVLVIQILNTTYRNSIQTAQCSLNFNKNKEMGSSQEKYWLKYERVVVKKKKRKGKVSANERERETESCQDLIKVLWAEEWAKPNK